MEATVSDFMSGGRILSHGKITSLASGFKLKNDMPFTVYIRPKNGSTDIDVIIPVKLRKENDTTDVPVTFNDWSPLAITEIGASTITDDNDVYWGSGEKAEPEV